MSLEPDRYEIGVLLVHGIGRRERGDTLLRFGEPLVEALRDTLSTARPIGGVPWSRGGVHLSSVELTDPNEGPARCEVHLRSVGALRLEDGRYPDRPDSTWMIAESWWDATFPPPTYSDLVKWGLTALPWTLVAHFERRARRAVYAFQWARSPRGRMLAFLKVWPALAALAVGILSVPVLLAGLAVILLVGLIPAARSAAASLQRLLAATVGDSQVLLGRPIAAEAIFTRVETDLRWLADRCDQLVVIAHSQGAAIAHEVLRRNPGVRCDNLITLGSGLKKLAEIQDPGGPRARTQLWASVVSLYVFSLSVWASFVTGDPERAGLFRMLAAMAGLGGTLFVLAWGRYSGRSMQLDTQQALDRRRFLERFRLPESVQRWVDVYAAADPVPNGPLLDGPLSSTPPELRIPESHETWNRGSYLTDHTTYWHNLDDCTSRVLDVLLEMAGFDLDKVDDRRFPRHVATSARRTCRVRWLAWARVLWMTCVAAVLVIWAEGEPSPGQGILVASARWVSGLPLIGSLVYEPNTTRITTGYRYGFLVVAALAVYALLTAVWSAWDRQDTRLFFGRAAYPSMVTSRGAPFALGMGVLFLTALSLVLHFPLWVAVPVTAATVAVPAVLTHRRWLPHGPVEEAAQEVYDANRKRIEREFAHGNPWAAYERAGYVAPEERRSTLELAAEWGSADAAWWLAQELTDDDPEGALEAYDLGIALEDGFCAYFKGTLLADLGRTDDARQALEDALEFGYAGAAVSLGVLLAQEAGSDRDPETLDQVERAYERGAALGDGMSARFLAEVRLERGDTDGAMAAFQLATALGDPHAPRELGELLRSRGRLSQALDAFRTGRRLRDPRSAIAEGDLLRGLQDQEGAASAYRAAISDDWREGDHWEFARPRAVARERLGTLFADQGKVELARLILERAAAEQSASAAVRLGRLIEERPTELGHHDSYAAYSAAARAYDRGIELGDADAAFLRARLEEGEYGFHSADYEIAASMGSADAAMRLAEEASRLSDQEETMRQLERASSLGSEAARERLRDFRFSPEGQAGDL